VRWKFWKTLVRRNAAAADTREELEKSRARLEETRPLKRSFTEMMEENHVTDLIRGAIRNQRREGSG
jgi:hypothetical protein